MTKAVIFDLWGTLAMPYEQFDDRARRRPNPVMQFLNRIGIEQYEYEVTRPFAYATMTERRSVDESVKILLDEMGIVGAPELIAELGSIMKKIDSRDGVPYKDSVPILKELKRRKMVTAILSNAIYVEDLHKERYMSREWGFDKYIDEPVFSFDIGVLKPDPAAFFAVLKRLDVEPEDSIFIDDFPMNVDAAEELGIRGLLIDRQGNHNHPNRISSLSEIKKYL